MNILRKFEIKLLLLLFLLITVSFGVTNYTQKISFNSLLFANLFLAALTFILFKLGKLGIQAKQHGTFIKVVMGSTFIRLLFSGGYLFIYLLVNNIDVKYFVISYILLYFLYMSFEIIHLLSNLRPDSEQTKNV
jgi:hypothetical protein